MKLKRTAAVILALMISFLSFPAHTMAADSKTETVYAALSSDGSVDKIYVVNQLIGQYTDYGNYTEIKNLSTTSEPGINGDIITFPDEYVEGGLYYQGTTQGELPFVFAISYHLDGKPVMGDDLAGASGRLEIRIKGAVNEKCAENVRKGYMAQISLLLDQSKAKGITCEGATMVAAGRTMNVSYTILPGSSAEYSLTADISDFEMDGISILLIKGTIAGMSDTINETQDGFDEMLSGAEEMVDGTWELKDGMSSLADGLKKLNGGMSKLESSGDKIFSGIKDFSLGLNGYTNGVSGIASGSSEIKAGLDTLASNASGVAGGISNISSGLTALTSSSDDLRALAQLLLSNPDPDVQALAYGTLEYLESVSTLSTGLSEASSGVEGFVSGAEAAAEGYGDFDAGLSALSANGSELVSGYEEIKGGFGAYLSGIKSSAKGVRKIYDSVKGLPGDIQKLIDGQIEFKDGISSAKDDILSRTEGFIADDSPAVSFASPDKNHPSSVQYILKTPSITVAEISNGQQPEKKNEDFFTRLADLFR